jgi:hypothetical protein
VLRGGSDVGRVEALKALCHFAARNKANRAAIVAAGALPLLVDLLRDYSASVVAGPCCGTSH